MILCLAKGTSHIVTIEDHVVAGGFGSAVLELLERRGIRDVDVRVIGLPDKFVEHGAVTILKELYGLSSAYIKEVVHDQLKSVKRP
jgi:1-deoxy-D-xylulose-5-phosphate synthase